MFKIKKVTALNVINLKRFTQALKVITAQKKLKPQFVDRYFHQDDSDLKKKIIKEFMECNINHKHTTYSIAIQSLFTKNQIITLKNSWFVFFI